MYVFITARKRSLRRLCFYRCLSFCPQGGVRGCSGGGGACVVALGGCAWLLLGGVHGCSGGHAWLLRGCMVALGGMHGFPGGMHGFSGGDMHGFFDEVRSMSRRYASYWNAFLLLNFSFTTLALRFKMFIASKEVMIENVLNRFGRS